MNPYSCKIIEKAYCLNLKKIEEGYLYSDVVIYAENRNKAKLKLLNHIRYDDYVLKYKNEYLNYLNIPIKRYKEADYVEFRKEKVKRYDIERIVKKEKRNSEFDAILNDDNITHCYILKRGTYYCDNWCGYTSHVCDAGIYTKYEAIKHAKSCDEIFLEYTNKETHNKMINDKISYLKTKLIK